MTGARSAILRDLAVAPALQRSGHGGTLIDHLRATLDSIEGDTLAGSAGFYLACGFEVRQDGALPSGEIIYRFSWRSDE